MALFVGLIILMFTFVLGGDTGLWNNVLAFLQNQKEIFWNLLHLYMIYILEITLDTKI